MAAATPRNRLSGCRGGIAASPATSWRPWSLSLWLSYGVLRAGVWRSVSRAGEMRPDVLTWLLCVSCGDVVAEQRHRPITPCTCAMPGQVWRVLLEAEVDELFRLPPYVLTLPDIILLCAFGIDPELPGR